jgi:hypothetical protein
MTQLFTQRALKNRHRVGDQNGPITLLTPPLRLTMLLGLLIAGGVGLWSILARIPISVRGTGVLLPVSTINRTLSGTSGSAHWVFNSPTVDWHRYALAFHRRPDQLSDAQVRALAAEVLQASEGVMKTSKLARREGAGESIAERFTENMKDVLYGRLIPAGTLMLWIKSGVNQERLQSSLDQLRYTLRDNKAKEQNIIDKQQILELELKSRQSYLQQMLKLEAKGFVSTASILQEQGHVESIHSQILNNKNELISLSNQMNKACQNLRNELALFIDEEMIFAGRDVYLSQVIPNDGEIVSQGQAVLELSADDLNDISLVPLFLSSKEMAQVFPGMPAIATPSGYERSEVGGIRSEVVSIAKIPSSKDFVIARIGVESLAQEIMKLEPAPTLAVLKLKHERTKGARNTGGYEWTSRGNLPFPPTPGDRLEVEITTRKVAPIELVLPAMRRFFGWSPPPPPDAVAPANSAP